MRRGRGRVRAAEDGAERGQRARQQPAAGATGLLLCERFLSGTHLLAGAHAGPALAASG